MKSLLSHPVVSCLFLTWVIGASPTPVLAQRFYPTNVTANIVSDMDGATILRLLADYELHTNLWSPADLLPIGIGYSSASRFAESEKAYLSYLKVKPDDSLANRGLGGVYMVQKRFDEAIKFVEKALRGGDEQSLPLLAALYIQTNQPDKLRAMLPELLQARKQAEGILRDNIVSVLAGYAVSAKPFDKGVFLKAVGGMTDAELIEIGDSTLEVLIEGMKLAGDKQRAETLSKRWKKQKSKAKK